MAATVDERHGPGVCRAGGYAGRRVRPDGFPVHADRAVRGAARGGRGRPAAGRQRGVSCGWSRRRPSRPRWWSCSRSRTTRARAWTVTAPARSSTSVTSGRTRPRPAGRGSPPPPPGWASSASTPSRCGYVIQVLGTLNLFRSAPDGLESSRSRWAGRALVDVATIGILQERAIHPARGRRRAVAGGAEQPRHHRAGQGHSRGAAAGPPRTRPS